MVTIQIKVGFLKSLIKPEFYFWLGGIQME